jgi:hypothetical protein
MTSDDVAWRSSQPKRTGGLAANEIWRGLPKIAHALNMSEDTERSSDRQATIPRRRVMLERLISREGQWQIEPQ